MGPGGDCAPPLGRRSGFRTARSKPFLRRKRPEVPGASRWSAINRRVDPTKNELDTRRPSHGSAEDLARAKKLGVSAGGDIMIHGLPNGRGWLGRAHLAMDWTAGCIAVTDAEIEEIWRLVGDGTRIQINP